MFIPLNHLFVLVETFHTGRDIRYRIRGFGLPANQIMFVRGASDDAGDASLGQKISVADFFAEKYQKLKYPNLPCIDGMSGTQKRANWLPMEMVKVCIFSKLYGSHVSIFVIS